MKKYESGQCLENPNLKGKQNTQKIHANIHFLKEGLSQRIYRYHEKNEYFTINDLLNHAKSDLEYVGGRTTLLGIVKSMGYKYKKVNGRKILCETGRIKALKIAFLRKYLQLVDSSTPPVFVFLDESWIFQNGSSVKLATQK